MTERASDRLWSGIDISKTIAAALAAVCAAVVGSFLGVAGTLIGAAVASIIGSVGTEIYVRSINKGRKKLETIAPAFVKAPAAVGTPQVAAATEDDSPSRTVPPRRQIRWGRVAMIAGALFVLAMGSLTVTELILGRSVASTVGNGTKATTTFGGLLNPGGRSNPTPAPAPAPSPTPTPTDTTAPTTAPTTPPTTQAPTATTQPTTAPTTAPATAAPTSTGDGSANQGSNQVQNQGLSAPRNP